MARARLACFTLLVLLVPAAAARGQLFDVSASSDTTTVRAGGNSLISLVENLSGNQNQFAPLGKQAFTSSINYAGIPNAIQVGQSFDTAGNRVLDVRVPSVGLNRTFSSANGSLSDQVRDFLKKQGLADLTAFQSVVGRQSAAGVVDGNPLAADMLLADAGYQEFALHETPFDTDGRRFSTDGDAGGGGHTVTRYWAEGGVLDAGGQTGQYVDLTVATEFHFNDHLALSLTTPLRYQTIHSADIFSGGEVVGLPVTILPAEGGKFFWQVTPAAHAAFVGSQDLVSGGLIFGGQLDSSFGVNLGRGFTLTLADEAGYFHGADLDIAGYDFNTRLDQWQFKNGLQVQKAFGRLFLDASATWTNFLHDVFTDGYFSPGVGIGFKFGKGNHAGFRVGTTATSATGTTPAAGTCCCTSRSDQCRNSSGHNGRGRINDGNVGETHEVSAVERQDVADPAAEHGGDNPGVMRGLAPTLVADDQVLPPLDQVGWVAEQQHRPSDQAEFHPTFVWRSTQPVAGDRAGSHDPVLVQVLGNDTELVAGGLQGWPGGHDRAVHGVGRLGRRDQDVGIGQHHHSPHPS